MICELAAAKTGPVSVTHEFEWYPPIQFTKRTYNNAIYVTVSSGVARHILNLWQHSKHTRAPNSFSTLLINSLFETNLLLCRGNFYTDIIEGVHILAGKKLSSKKKASKNSQEEFFASLSQEMTIYYFLQVVVNILIIQGRILEKLRQQAMLF